MQWAPETGAWLVWWMKYQIFTPLFLLLLLNIFWYFLVWRIAYRYVWWSQLSLIRLRPSHAVQSLRERLMTRDQTTKTKRWIPRSNRTPDEIRFSTDSRGLITILRRTVTMPEILFT